MPGIIQLSPCEPFHLLADIVVYEEAKKGKAKAPNELLQYIPMNKIESFHCRQLTDYEDTALFEIDVVNGGKIEVIYRNDLKKTW
jgi:hypothetical protein